MTNLLRKKFRYVYFNATLILIIINIFMFILSAMFPKLKYLLSMNPVLVVRYKWVWQFVTCMFMHGNIQHIFFNMLGLFMFGLQVEKSLGSKEFLLLYFVCGTLANVFSFAIYMLTGQYNVFLLGASGALYSVLFAFAVIFPTVRVFIFGILPVPGPVLILLYTVIELGSQLFGLGGGVAHMTHLFGFVAAWAYFVIRIGVNPIKVWKNALRH
ncbi:MAG: rhomboid family intramembrane serine protease [Treponema sp.]